MGIWLQSQGGASVLCPCRVSPGFIPLPDPIDQMWGSLGCSMVLLLWLSWSLIGLIEFLQQRELDLIYSKDEHADQQNVLFLGIHSSSYFPVSLSFWSVRLSNTIHQTSYVPIIICCHVIISTQWPTKVLLNTHSQWVKYVRQLSCLLSALDNVLNWSICGRLGYQLPSWLIIIQAAVSSSVSTWYWNVNLSVSSTASNDALLPFPHLFNLAEPCKVFGG